MGAELDIFVCHFPQGTETENLKAAAVCQDRFVPSDKFMQSAAAGDEFVIGAQIQMIGIA